MEQLFFAGKAYLKINSLVKTPLHEFMAVERSRLWAPVIVGLSISLGGRAQQMFIRGDSAPRSNPPLTLLYTIFHEKGTPFAYPVLANGTPFT